MPEFKVWLWLLTAVPAPSSPWEAVVMAQGLGFLPTRRAHVWVPAFGFDLAHFPAIVDTGRVNQQTGVYIHVCSLSQKKFRLNSCLTPYREIDSKWIKDYNDMCLKSLKVTHEERKDILESSSHIIMFCSFRLPCNTQMS